MIDNEKTEYNLDTLIKKFEAYHNVPNDVELIRRSMPIAAGKAQNPGAQVGRAVYHASFACGVHHCGFGT